MKVSAKEQYGLRAMIELAERYGQGAISLSAVAESQGISMDYLEQMVPDLLEAGLVLSKRGAYGGYRLARSAGRDLGGSDPRGVGGICSLCAV